MVLRIGGMTCAGCAVAIQESLSEVRGVGGCSVNPVSRSAVLEYEPGEAGLAQIEEAVRRAGYEVVYEEVAVDGGSLDGSRLEEVRGMPGVRAVLTGGRSSKVRVRYNPALLQEEDVTRALGVRGSGSGSRGNGVPRMLVVSAALSVPVILLSDAGSAYVGLGASQWAPYAMLFCAGAVQFLAGRSLYAGAFRTARAGSAGMDTLIVLGTTAAFLYSAYGALWAPQQNTYFETSAMIITFVLLGRYIEGRAAGRASSAITGMLKMRPRTATILRDGAESTVATESLRPGDTVLVRPGQGIPADSLVVGGSSYVDESMVTGESAPAARSPGDPVIGGTLNLDGALTLKVESVGASSFLARVVDRMEVAISRKPPVQKLADAVAGRLTLAVMSAALATFLLWGAFGGSDSIAESLIPTVAVLVVSCPCALGLATPTAITAGMGAAARMGVIFREGRSLEALAKIDIVAFDKTGTLTRGRPKVTGAIPRDGTSEEELLTLAASAQQNSGHPLAHATVEYARGRGIRLVAPGGFTSVPGMGVRAVVSGRRVVVGSVDMMERCGIDPDEDVPTVGTASFVAADGAVIGVLSFADEPRSAAGDAVRRLGEMGIDAVMLTGDSADAARDVAGKAGIGTVYAGMLPGDKADAIARLQRDGKSVAMVGDGINDAPALSQADVGIAVGGGTDLAIGSADVILMRGDPSGVADAVDISRRTYGKIRQNIVYAFAYNMVLVPVAGAGLLHPAMAGMAMAASSVSVVANSLLLGRRRNAVRGSVFNGSGGTPYHGSPGEGEAGNEDGRVAGVRR